jgi:hypothetical protein
MMRENFGVRSFTQALISKGLKIICKNLRGNLYRLLEGVGGTSLRYGPVTSLTEGQWSVISSQWSENPALLIASIVRQRRVIFGKPPAVGQTPSARSGQVLGQRARPTSDFRDLIGCSIGLMGVWNHPETHTWLFLPL